METKSIIYLTLSILISTPSLFLYTFYQSWIGLIGFGISLLILTIFSRIKKKELEIKSKNMTQNQKNLNKILKIITYTLLTILLIFSISLFYEGNLKSALFSLQIAFFMFLSSWRMP